MPPGAYYDYYYCENGVLFEAKIVGEGTPTGTKNLMLKIDGQTVNNIPVATAPPSVFPCYWNKTIGLQEYPMGASR